ncbi:MAG TPA: IS1595 family transposase [Candidatus Acidoferrales bacterium]|nr:IS1595 family transposase [Candidatus Acidoferrales bacterium]
MKVKQHIPKALRYSIRDFNIEFPDDSACLDYIKERRFPGGMSDCAKCAKQTKHHRVGNRTAYACQYCGNHIYPLAGTIFEKTTTPLRLWFYAAYLMGSTRCGISAKQIQREIGVTYKTAWRMFRQIRSMLSEGELEMEGPTVEIDETYVGGVRKGRHGRPMRGDQQKTPVVAIVQRAGGKVVARAMPDLTGKRIRKMIRQHVVPGSVIYTDDYYVYRRIPEMMRDGKPMKFQHFRIKHSEGEYVRDGHIHTNTVEGFWMLLKTGIRGVYHSVSPKYLQSYLNEYTFRFNRRHDGNQQFRSILERVSQRAA